MTARMKCTNGHVSGAVEAAVEALQMPDPKPADPVPQIAPAPEVDQIRSPRLVAGQGWPLPECPTFKGSGIVVGSIRVR